MFSTKNNDYYSDRITQLQYKKNYSFQILVMIEDIYCSEILYFLFRYTAPT